MTHLVAGSRPGVGTWELVLFSLEPIAVFARLQPPTTRMSEVDGDLRGFS